MGISNLLPEIDVINEGPEVCGGCEGEFKTLNEVFSHPCPASPRYQRKMASAVKVDLPSEKQETYLLSLIGAEKVEEMKKSGWSKATVSKAIDEALKAKPVQIDLPSEKQVTFLKSLFASKTTTDPEAIWVTLNKATPLSKKQVSSMIDVLMKEPDVKKEEIKSAPTTNQDGPEEGFYKVEGEIYKVQQNLSCTNKYAKKLLIIGSGEDAEFEWEYVGKSPFRSLTAETKVNKEDTEEFGELYGRCMRCSRKLTDEGSIEAGLGMVCASKMGW